MYWRKANQRPLSLMGVGVLSHGSTGGNSSSGCGAGLRSSLLAHVVPHAPNAEADEQTELVLVIYMFETSCKNAAVP